MDLYSNMIDKLAQPPLWSEEDEQVSSPRLACSLIDTNELLKALTEPFSYITAYPGKEIRGRMIEAFNLWLNVPQEKLLVISKVVSMLHSSSLL